MTAGANIPPRITLITLGVANLARAQTFYEALGFVASPASQDDVAFYQSGGIGLALYPRDKLAEDAAVADTSPGFSGVTLALNLRSETAVDQFFAHALACGAKQTKAPQKAFWGGYSGYFADPDRHLWEVAHNPFFPLKDDGSLVLPA